MEAVPLSGNHFVYLNLFLLVEAIPLVEAISFSGNHFFLMKPFLLVETVPLGRSHFF